jgi:hypothetical protein
MSDPLGLTPPAQHPVVLLPGRLETRFVTGARSELLVRIYPDDVHVDSHEPELTDDEALWGRHFWAQLWRCGSGTDQQTTSRRHRVWEQLAQRLGPARAAWVTTALQPTNPQDRPADPVADDADLPLEPRHPPHGTRTDTWTRPPLARLLPERWVVLAHRGGRRVMTTVGAAIPEALAVGPDPAAGVSPPADDRLVVDPGMAWLVDFDEAERVGMAVRVGLSADDARLGFDTVIAVGLRRAASPQAAADELHRLLDGHRFTGGLAVLAPGVATNNSPSEASGFAPRTSDPATDYPLDRPLLVDGATGWALAIALGVDAAAWEPVDGASGQDEAEARALQILLWPATAGYLLDHLLNVFPPATVEAARRHFVDHVRAMGPLPTVRIGRQPYGLLPATTLDRWPADAGDPTVLGALRALRQRWRGVVPNVPRLERRAGASPGAAQAGTVLSILGTGPSSTGFAARLVLDQRVFGVPGFHAAFQLPAAATTRSRNLRTLLQGLGLNGDARLLSTVLAAGATDLTSRSLADGPGSADAVAAYLRWLRDAPHPAIRDEADLPGPRPDHLVLLLARHGVLATYAATAAALGAASPTGGRAEPEPAVIDVVEARTATLGRLADLPLADLPGRRVDTLTAADHPAAARLDEMRAALDRLAVMAPDRLEALTTTTLDLFSYRLDAWVTSLATRRLAELRQAEPAGSFVGGYAWIHDVRPGPARQPAPVPPLEAGSPLTLDPANAGFVHAPSLNQAAAAAVLRAGYRAFGGGQASHPFAVDLSSRRLRQAEWLLDGVRQGQPLGVLLGYRFERGLHDRRLDQYLRPFRRIAPFGELATTEARAADTAARVAELRSSGHPELPAANVAVTTAQRRHSALVNERNAIAGQLATARNRRDQLRAQVDAIGNQIRRQEDILRRQPLNERANEQLIDLNIRLSDVAGQLTSANAEVTRLERRQTALPGEITAADTALRQARQRVQDLARLPHPGLAAAERAATEARRAFDEALERARQRYLYPPTATSGAMESVAADHVVDGLALLELHQRGAIPFGHNDLPRPGTADHRNVLAELDALEQAVDAVGDALTAESVYQLVQGNPMRAGASLDAVARNQAPPPELELSRTPRSGVAVTHRLVVLANAAAGPVPGWPTDARQVRAGAEPTLEAWAASLLGDPALIRSDVSYHDPASGVVLARRDLRMRSTGLGALDLLALVDEAGRPRPELERYLRDRLLATRPAAVPADAEARLSYDHQPDWPAGVRSFAHAFEVARALAAVIDGARPLDGTDLGRPEDAVAPSVDLSELQGRADAVVRRLAVALAALDRALDGQDLAAVGRALVPMLFFGAADGVPALSLPPTDAAHDELRARARAVAAELRARLEEALAAEAAFDRAAAGVDRRRDHDLGRISMVLGPGFRALPRLSADGDRLGPALAGGTDRFGGDPLAPFTWLHRMASVRAPVGRLQTALLYAEAGGRIGELVVAQLPPAPAERWVGLAQPGTGPPDGDRLSIVAQAPEPVDPARPLAGLFIDEWTEVIPHRNEVTGVAFNFDEPAGQPPQAILVAVPPPGETRWTLDGLEAILLETFDLARVRAVTPELLAAHTDLEQLLPALYFGLNLSNDTVSTDFTRAMG